MENISAGAAVSRQPDIGESDNDCNELTSAFSLCATRADSSATAFDPCSEPGEGGPPDKHVCTRSVAPIAPEGKPGQEAVRSTTDVDTCSHDFACWVDRFLNIPVDEYLKLDDSVLQKIESSYHSYIKRPDITKDVAATAKIKHLLNRLLCNWCLKQNREQTKKQLISLYEYAQDRLNLTHYVQNWVFMKCFKDILYGRPVSERTKQSFVTIMNETIYMGSIFGITNSSLPILDTISLIILYYTGGLYGFEDGANYERGFHLLNLHRKILEGDGGYLFFSPISFTAIDYMRFAPKDLIQKLDDQKKEVVPDAANVNIMQLVTSIFMCPEYCPILTPSRQTDYFHYQTYQSIRSILADFYNVIEITGQRGKRGKSLQDLSHKKDKLFSHMQQCEKATAGTQNDCLGLFNFLRAEVIRSEKTLKPRCRYAKIAALYAATAEHSPNHWSSAYNYYCKAGIWNEAANAIRHYAHYWQGKDADTVEYWSDLYSRAMQATHANPGDPASDVQEQDDIDTIMREFAVSPPAVAKKHKNRKQRQCAAKANPDAKQHGNSSQSADQQSRAASSNSEQDNSRPCRPVVKALPFGPNYYDGLSGEYQIKATQRAIQPFEKLLSKYWNPLVKKTLNLIREARSACDPDRERHIYQKLLNNPTLKTCIGIERIWEEYAWTELHQFDDCFKTRVMAESIRPRAQEWVNVAKDYYIMPSLAYCLGLDQICTSITPEAVWEAVQQLVEQPELSEPAVNQEVRFRLRCLFSSMGHTYSLCAMARPGQASQLMQFARQWYGYKTIDPQYERRRRGTNP